MLTLYDTGEEFLQDANELWIMNDYVARGFFEKNCEQFGTLYQTDFAAHYSNYGGDILAIRQGSYPMFFAGDVEVVPDFVKALSRTQYHVQKVMAAKPLYDALMKACPDNIVTGFDQKKDMLLMVHELPAIARRNPNARHAEEQDVDAIVSLEKTFESLTNTQQFVAPSERPAKVLENLKNYAVVEVNGEVVSMAKRTRDTEVACSISGVVTHGYHVNKGYAQQVVDFLAQEIIAEGKACYLFAEAQNMTAQHVYERINFMVKQTYVNAQLMGPRMYV